MINTNSSMLKKCIYFRLNQLNDQLEKRNEGYAEIRYGELVIFTNHGDRWPEKQTKEWFKEYFDLKEVYSVHMDQNRFFPGIWISYKE